MSTNGTNGATPPGLTLLNPRRVREDSEVHVDLGDGTFIKCRREDMTLLVFEGRVPMTMLTAVQNMIDLPDASPMQRMEALGGDAGRGLIEVVRSHACKVALEPKLVPVDDGNPDHLPVTYLNVPQLMAIWSATAVIPQVGPTAAATFRALADSHDDPPVANVPGVSPAPVAVAPPRIEKFVSH